MIAITAGVNFLSTLYESMNFLKKAIFHLLLFLLPGFIPWIFNNIREQSFDFVLVGDCGWAKEGLSIADLVGSGLVGSVEEHGGGRRHVPTLLDKGANFTGGWCIAIGRVS